MRKAEEHAVRCIMSIVDIMYIMVVDNQNNNNKWQETSFTG